MNITLLDDLNTQIFSETLYEQNWKQSMKASKILFEGKSKYQDVKIFENPIFGKVLTLDNIVQTTQNDEFIYHEMLAHVPILSHGNVKKVLIIGGGDGGMLREVVRHSSIEKAVMVEIDGLVVDKCAEFMPTLSNGAYEDKRAEIIIGDGIEYVKNTKEKFDIIICDSTDPIGPGIVLFTKEFYSYCKNALNPDGIIVTQNGIPFSQKDELKTTYLNRKEFFEENKYYIAAVPSYIGGFMAFGWATDNKNAYQRPISEIKTKLAVMQGKMKYYTPSIHKASFSLPQYIQDLIEI